MISLLYIRYPVTGSGAAVSSARWDFMISQVPVPYIWLVVLQPLSVPSSLDLVSENIPRAVNQKLFLVITLHRCFGVFILWFCWFGFNGASTVSMEGDAIVRAGKIFVTTNLAAAVATVTVLIITWIRYKKPDVPCH